MWPGKGAFPPAWLTTGLQKSHTLHHSPSWLDKGALREDNRREDRREACFPEGEKRAFRRRKGLKVNFGRARTSLRFSTLWSQQQPQKRQAGEEIIIRVKGIKKVAWWDLVLSAVTASFLQSAQLHEISERRHRCFDRHCDGTKSGREIIVAGFSAQGHGDGVSEWVSERGSEWVLHAKLSLQAQLGAQQILQLQALRMELIHSPPEWINSGRYHFLRTLQGRRQIHERSQWPPQRSDHRENVRKPAMPAPPVKPWFSHESRHFLGLKWLNRHRIRFGNPQ